MRGLLALGLTGFLASAALLSACEKPGGGDKAGASPEDVNRFRAEVNPNTPYAGQWAAAASNCDDAAKIWTIEAHRMGVRRARFCAFKSMSVNQPGGSEDAVWAVTADCLADGHESRDFVFFRVKSDLRRMRVTFNDGRPVDLVRCLSRS